MKPAASKAVEDVIPPLGDLLEFLRLMWAVDSGLQSASKRMLRTLGITAPQRLAIRMIGRFPGMSAGRLAVLLRLHPSTLTGVLSRLDGLGHLRRKRDPRDGRRVQLFLTTSGRRLGGADTGTVEETVAYAMNQVSSSDLNGAKRVLRAIAHELEGRGRQALEEPRHPRPRRSR